MHCFAPLSRSAAAAAAVHNAWANASYFVRQQSNGGGSRGGSRGGWRGGNAEQRSGAEPRESRGPPRAPAASSADANFTLEGLIGGDSDEETQRAGRSALGDDVVLSPGVEVHDLDKEVDPDIRSARDELRAALESEARSARAAAEAAAARGAMPAIVDRFGEALPLNSDDERHLPFLPADHLDEASQRRAAQRLRYHSRAVRSTYDSDELEMYALALEREFGSDLELSDVEEEGLRATDYPLGRDPLLDAKTPLPFNVNALAFKTHMNWSGPPGSDQLDRCVRVRACMRACVCDGGVCIVCGCVCVYSTCDEGVVVLCDEGVVFCESTGRRGFGNLYCVCSERERAVFFIVPFLCAHRNAAVRYSVATCAT